MHLHSKYQTVKLSSNTYLMLYAGKGTLNLPSWGMGTTCSIKRGVQINFNVNLCIGLSKLEIGFTTFTGIQFYCLH